MKKELLAAIFLLAGFWAAAQTYTSDFDGTDQLTLSLSGVTSQSGSASYPTSNGSNPSYGNPDNGGVVNDGTGTVTTSSITTTTISSFSFDLASLAGTSGNGSDGTDNVVVSISVDGGVNFSDEIEISGNSNAQWTYTGGGDSTTSAYDGNNTPLQDAPGGGGSRDDDNDGIAEVTVSDIPAGDVVIRITLSNNSANEYWAIDNLILTESGNNVCSILINNVSASCNGDDAEIVVDYTATNGSGTYEVDINGEGYQTLASGGTYTITGPTTAVAGATVTVRDTADNTCEATSTVDIPACPNTQSTGGELTFQMVNPCGNDGDNEFVVFTSGSDPITIDDIALGSVNDNTDTSWNYFWSTSVDGGSGPAVTENGNAVTTTATNDYGILDPVADAADYNAAVAELNAITGSTTFISPDQTNGEIPAGANVVFFIGYGDDGFDSADPNLDFTPQIDNEPFYLILGKGTGSGYFSNSDPRTQYITIGGEQTNVAYDPNNPTVVGSGGGGEYLSPDSTYTEDEVCIPSTSLTEVECSIAISSVNATCNGDDAEITVNYTASNGSGTYEVDVNGEGYQTLASGATYTITGPTTSETGVTVTVRDVNETTCQATSTVDIPTCPTTGNGNCPAGTTQIAGFDFDAESSWSNDISTFYFEDPDGAANGELSVVAARNSAENTNFSDNTLFGRDFTPESSDNNVPANLNPYAFTFSNVDVSNYQDITVSFDYYAFANADNGDYKIVIDGTAQNAVEYFNDPDTGQSGTISIPVANGTQTVGLILEGTLNGTNDIIEFDNFSICGSPIINPVEFVNVSALWISENKSAVIQWSTASESNNDFFEIQHSVDGLHWSAAGIVAGSGTTQIAQDYEFIHHGALNGINYYRLKQVDTDGQFAYSDIVSLDAEFAEEIKVAAVNKTSMTILSSLSGTAHYSIYNSLGTLVNHGQLEAVKGAQSIYYNNSLKSGFYIVELMIEGKSVTGKFIVH